ncbi:dihydrofolate reductase family protein [Salinibacterium hongtaonis]|uniref:dihydrofolate reductase family protein n=1 Tax=Homoserinimonas hongtaonis TaxID=2079791 RepID=UPI000D3C735E|nr:dihydrofolate reductase family protein [Salinibacterium hongtaonis]AWB89176.1 deaminase [Salinibacterium hongtaonis]
MSGRIEIDLFSTLDGVMQAPGGAEEDPEEGFAFGGWQAPVDDDAVGDEVIAGIRRIDALLLGRRTYDIFAGYWPQQLGPGGAANEIARVFDGIPKYVASRGTPDLRWRDSHHLGSDLAAEIAALRERHREIHVIGSIDFARTLVREGLFDQLNLWVYPIVLGPGKRLFTSDGPPASFTLLPSSRVSEQGALLLHYAPKGTTPTTAEMGKRD